MFGTRPNSFCSVCKDNIVAARTLLLGFGQFRNSDSTLIKGMPRLSLLVPQHGTTFVEDSQLARKGSKDTRGMYLSMGKLGV